MILRRVMSEENKYLERAIEKYSTCSDEEKSLLEGIFPELRETVDEKIKEAIRYAIGQSKHADGTLISGISEEIALAYLDRNKEEKKEDSGFKVGDWVVNNHGSRSVCLVIERGWPNSRIQDERNECYINSETLNKQYHLWTIQDAEVGDILANKFGCVFIYNGYENDDKVTVDNICHVNIPGEFQIEDHKTGSWFYVSDLMPATRQQRALLFQNIKVARYEWDEKALILKKIEKTEVEWSEKDDKTIHLACEFIRHHSGKNDSIGGVDCSELINRLKSLPFRPQSKQEWSEEDKLTVDSAIFWLKRRLLSEKTVDISTDSCPLSMRKTIERLNSLRPHTHWKPSEEQMEALECAEKWYSDNMGCNKALYQLLCDLKKLM